MITTYSPLQPIAMPPIQNNSVVPKKQASKVWRYLGDNLDGAIAKCLLCMYNPTKGSALVIKVCQGSTKALRNHLQAQNKRDMVKEEE